MKKFMEVLKKYTKERGVAIYYTDSDNNFSEYNGVYVALIAPITYSYKVSTPFGNIMNTSIGGGVYRTIEEMKEEWKEI